MWFEDIFGALWSKIQLGFFYICFGACPFMMSLVLCLVFLVTSHLSFRARVASLICNLADVMYSLQ